MAEKWGTKYQFFANSSTVTVTDGTDVYTVGVLRNCEITVNFEHVPLYGMESIIMQNVAKHTMTIDISVKFGSFDPTLANDFFGAVLNPTSPSSGTVQDTNKVKTFGMTCQVQSFDTSPKKYLATLSNVYFESLPTLTLTENEWIARDCKMKAGNIVLTNPA